MDNLRGTKWRNKRNPKFVGAITFHRPRTGRIAFRRPDDSIYRANLEDLMRNWERV